MSAPAGHAEERDSPVARSGAGAGTAAICLAAILWAVGGTFARFLIDRGASVVELTEARAWIATAGLALIVLARRSPAPASARGDRWLLIVFGLAITSANLTYYLSLSRLPVAVAIVIQYTAPGLVVVWSALVRRQRVGPWVVRALILALIGVALLSELPRVVAEGRLTLAPTGLAAAAGASVSFAVYMLVGERVGAAFGTTRALLYGFAVASGLWAVVQAASGVPTTLLDPDFIPGVVFLGVATTLCPFALFVWGLGRIDASRAGIISTLEPLSAAVFAFVFLGQRLSLLQVAGAALIVGGIAVVQARRAAPPEVLIERAVVE